MRPGASAELYLIIYGPPCIPRAKLSKQRKSVKYVQHDCYNRHPPERWNVYNTNLENDKDEQQMKRCIRVREQVRERKKERG